MAKKFLISIAVMATGTAFLIITYEVKEQRLQSENLRTELGFLPSQASPHFMFNTPNNLVALAPKKMPSPSTSSWPRPGAGTTRP